MIRLPLWRVIFVVLVCVASVAYAAPNLMSREQAEAWAAKVPSFVPSRTISLGLDLQGGSHLMLEVGIDVAIRDQAESAMNVVRSELRSEKLPYTSLRASAQGFNVTLRNAADVDAASRLIRKTDPELVVEKGDDGANSLRVAFSETKLRQIGDHAIEQSIEIVRRRVDESGTREPVIARQGEDRIVLQLPGLDDPEALKKLLGTTAKLGLHMVNEDATRTGRAGVGDVLLPSQDIPGQKLAVSKRAMITGDMLTNAQPSFNQNGQPVVTFQLNSLGAKRFCEVTSKNVNKPFAIVLDEVVISAPVINEAICGGSAQISGRFTVEDTNNMALLLRAGALPAPLKIVEERSVGPSLGSDSVAAGKKAFLIALLFVTVFITSVYGLFGLFASFAVIVNMIMVAAVMSALQATLTLPGIAGLVLIIGIAVDGNVLVYERIKEELRDGRSLISAIDIGYQRAHTVIIDSNLTALISAIILFSFGTGPIKGFAVTTSIGVVTSYFCSLMLTHTMVIAWLKLARPKTIEV